MGPELLRLLTIKAHSNIKPRQADSEEKRAPAKPEENAQMGLSGERVYERPSLCQEASDLANRLPVRR